MEDSFRVRVDKVFGNLGSNTASSVGVGPSLWCLTDYEIERREWNRSRGVAEDGEEEAGESGPSVVGNNLVLDFKELSDHEEEEEGDGDEIDGETEKRRRNNSSNAGAGDDEFLDVQSNIGRDCTLDYEEEEDEYDKVAVGMDHTGDRLYMRDVKYADNEVDEVSGYGELSNTFKAIVRDPRANHVTAKIRLREDAEAAGDIDLQLSDNSMAAHSEFEDLKKWELDSENPKPILKRRDKLMDSRSQKRVRFMVDPKNSAYDDQQSTGASDLTSEPHTVNESAVSEQTSDHVSQYSTGVPDYVRNPSKYTRYTFDSSDHMDDESNRKAYSDLFDYFRKRNTDISQEDTSVEIPKSILFTAKKKPEHDSTAKKSAGKHKTKGNLENKSWSVGITTEDTVESEVSAMEEDEPGLLADEGARSLRKSGRQYRARTNVDIDD